MKYPASYGEEADHSQKVSEWISLCFYWFIAYLGRMKRIVLIFLLVLSPLSTSAESLGTTIWLGKVGVDDKAKWEGDGFSVVELTCADGDTPCVIQAIAALDHSDPAYLITYARHTAAVRALYASGMTKDQLSGIILLRAENGTVPAVETPANAPDLWVLAELSDPKESIVSARKLAFDLRDVGVSASFLFVNDGTLQYAPLGQMVRDFMLHFMGHSPFAEGFGDLLELEFAWQSPQFDSQDFLERDEFLSTYPMHPTLNAFVKTHYRFEAHRMQEWRMEKYLSFDLMAYRDEQAPGARYVTLRNRRGQVYYLDLETYGAYEPVIVVGIDDETNMFRMNWFYRTKKMYSWKPDVQNISVRPLGPLLFFRKEEEMPADLSIPLLLRSALTLEGIAFSQTDPLAPLAAYPVSVQNVITKENKCIFCHRIGALGARYHHLDARTALPQGGFALPLIEYSDEVMNAFLYDQVNTANKIGMTPNPLEKSVADTFYDWWKNLSKETGSSP